MTFKKYAIYLSILSVIITGCKDSSDEPNVAPSATDADFSYTSEPDNPNIILLEPHQVLKLGILTGTLAIILLLKD